MQGSGHRLLEHALDILDYIGSSSKPVVFKKLKEAISLPKSTLNKLIHTLVYKGYLEKGQTGCYTIGIQCFKTGSAFRIIEPFWQRAKSIVEEVCKVCNETTHLAVLEGIYVVYIYKFDSTQPIRIYSREGRKIPAHTTAIGKALLSGYSDEEIYKLYPDAKLPVMTPNSIISIKELLDQLHEIRRISIAFESEESTPQVKCIAVPIRNSQGKPIAALSVAMGLSKKYRQLLNFWARDRQNIKI
jgi:DNA-binding IclR family transcriptional regulator